MRSLVQVPPEATWAELTLRTGAHAAPKTFFIHTTQLLPHARPMQHRQALVLTSEAATKSHFKVTGGSGMELALAQFWKTDGASEVAAELSFHGAAVPSKRLPLLGSDSVVRMMVRHGSSRTVAICRAADACTNAALRTLAKSMLACFERALRECLTLRDPTTALSRNQ